MVRSIRFAVPFWVVAALVVMPGRVVYGQEEPKVKAVDLIVELGGQIVYEMHEKEKLPVAVVMHGSMNELIVKKLVEALGPLKSVRSLDASYSTIADNGLTLLSGVQHLKSLNL